MATASTGNRLIDTTQSFTISTGVKPTMPGGVVVSEDGVHASRFYLQSSTTDNTWRFAMATGDAVNATYDQVVVPAGNRAGLWTHLIATYDAPSGSMTLFVNNTVAGSAHHKQRGDLAALG